MLNQHVDSTGNDPLAPVATPSDELQLGQFIPLHYHYNMLLDEDRMNAFRDAIFLLVKPGMRVVELGGGTGVLSSFAARAGGQVICVERNPVLAQKATELLDRNGLSRSVEVVLEDAMRFVPAEQVDVVICEMLHVAMLREKQLNVIAAFKENYRHRFGDDVKLPVFIPESSILMWQAVEQSFDFLDYWAPIPMFQSPRAIDTRTNPLTALDPYASVYYEQAIPLQFDVSQSIGAERSGTANAIRFVTQNVLAIDWQQQSAISWPNQYLILPLSHPVEMQVGASAIVSFQYRSGDPLESLSETLRLSFGSSCR